MRRLALIACALASVAGYAQTRDKMVVAYMLEGSPIWEPEYAIANIPGHRYDVLKYGFIGLNDSDNTAEIQNRYAALQHPSPTDDLTLPFRGNFNQLIVLKRRFPHLRTMISIKDPPLEMSNMMIDQPTRDRNIRSIVNMMRQYQFDGVDIDWEWPVTLTGRWADKTNLTLYMQQLRRELNIAGLQDGKRYLLSYASPGGYWNFLYFEPLLISREIDFFSVMSYDFAGPWSTQTGFTAPLYPIIPTGSRARFCTSYGFDQYIAMGVPPEKLMMGIPMYGRSWRDVPAVNNGVYERGSGPGTLSNRAQGTYTYRVLMERMLANPQDYPRYWHDGVKSPYIYSPTLENGTFITYEDLESIGHKLDFVQARNLGGVMLFERSGDMTNPDDPLSITKFVNTRLSRPSTLIANQTLGTRLRGDNSALVAADGIEWQLIPVSNLPANAPQTQVDITATVRVTRPNSMTVNWRGRSVMGSLLSFFYLWNYTTNQWDLMQSAPARNTGTTFTFTPDVASYLSPANQVRARIGFSVPSPTGSIQVAGVDSFWMTVN